MMKLNKERSMLVKAFVFVAFAIVLTVGVTYAYFSATIKGVESESTISVGGATLAIKYEGINSITAENVIPGWSAKKYFNVDVTNTSGKDISYDINLVVLNSNFYTTSNLGNSYLEYALYECSSDTDKTCETVIKSSSVLDIQSGEKLVYSATTKISVKTYYALELIFSNQDAVQSQTGTNDQPLTFNGYVTLESTGEVYVPPFTTDSWATIAGNIKSGDTVKYKVGDEKEVEIDVDGDGTAESYTVRVANNSNYDCTLESKTACGFVVEFVDIIEQRAINSSRTNKGGWPKTAMRTYLNGEFKAKLPSDLQSVIASTTVISGHGNSDSNSERDDGNWESTDQIYLLSTAEVWANGLIYDTAKDSKTTRQLDYYLKEGVTTSKYDAAIKNYAGSAAYWWLRTATKGSSISFLFVDSSGNWSSINALDSSSGIAPAFRIA